MLKTLRLLLPVRYLVTCYLFTSVLLAACAPQPAATPTMDISAASTDAVATIYAGATQTFQAIPSATPTMTPAPTALRTPPALPALFTSTELNPLDTPHTYIQDSCQYLKARWD